jgi:hypothetical protein
MWARPRSLVIGLWFTLFPMIFIPMVFALSAMIPHQADFKKVSSEGQPASGVVTRVDTVYNITINDVHPKAVHFTYAVGGEDRQATMDTMSLDEVADWKSGQPVQIRYLGPDAVIPSLEPLDFPFYLFYFLPFFFAIFGLPFLVYCGIGARQKIQIMKYGVLQQATLLSMTPISSFGSLGFFLKTQFEAIYSFIGPTGQPLIGKSHTGDLLLLNEKKKGELIDILVVPNRPGWSQILDGPTSSQIARFPLTAV